MFGGGQEFYENPTLVPVANYDLVWDSVVNVVDDYFTIDAEQRPRQVGGVVLMGRLDTFPEMGSTLLEPHRGDSVGVYERLESTLQTIRRRAVVQAIPGPEGFLIDVAVFKELEDSKRPQHATAGAATLRYDDSLTRFEEPIGGQAVTVGWIPQGRDELLEQRIIAQIQDCLSSAQQGGGGWFPFHARASNSSTR